MAMPATKAFSARIKSWRKDSALTLVQASSRAAVTASTWFQWEAGTSLPPSTRHPSLAQVMGISVESLAGMVARERSRRLVGNGHRSSSCPKHRVARVPKAGRS